MTADLRYRRSQRLLSAPDFKRVFDQRQVRRGRFFNAHWRRQDGDAAPSIAADRLGVVIAKKQLRTAVHRNLIKRMAREAFRRRAGTQGLDIVIRLAVKLDPATVASNRRALADELMSLFNAIALRAAKA